MIKGKHLLDKFWMEALMFANYVLNRCPTKAFRVVTPYEAWNGRKPMVSHMRVFGCLAYALVPSQQHHKLQDKAIKCIFVGYSAESKGYHLYHPLTDNIVVSCDVVFAENSAHPLLECKMQPTIRSQDIFDTLMPLFQSVTPDNGHVDQPNEVQRAENLHPNMAENQQNVQPIYDEQVDDVLHEKHTSIRDAQVMPRWLKQTLQDSKLSAPLLGRTRSSTRHASSDFVDVSLIAIACNEEPVSFEDACGNVEWMAAMQSELDSIQKNGTWELCDLPEGKARLVVKGYAQHYGIDYEETFAPTSRMTTIRTVVALAIHLGWKVHQSDVITAFLNDDLHEEVYVTQLPGFAIKGQEHKVCCLQKALYGLKQASRAWYAKIHRHLIALGFQCNPIENTLYVRKDGDDLIVLVLYVDDMLLTGSCELKIDPLKTNLQQDFEVTHIGHLSYYLGI